MNESSDQKSETSGVVKKTISLPKDTYEQGEAAAKRERRNFSNYIATLIEADGAELADQTPGVAK